MNKLLSSLLIGLALIGSSNEALSADLTVELNELRNTKGSIQLAIYDNEQDFNNDSVEDVFMALSSKINAETMKYTFHNVPNGSYAVTIIHDENGNQKLDMQGRTPLEGLAYSGTKSRLTKPSFDRASIKVDQNNEVIRIKLNYY